MATLKMIKLFFLLSFMGFNNNLYFYPTSLFQATQSQIKTSADYFQTKNTFFPILRNYCDNKNKYDEILALLQDYVQEQRFYSGSENEKIRNKLDHCYHGVYQRERVLLQDQIIKNYIHEQTIKAEQNYPLQEPTVIFVAGAIGVGKGHVIRRLKNCAYFAEQDFTLIDYDFIKEKLPEYQNWSAYWQQMSGQGLKATFVHKESAYLAEIIFEKMLLERGNIIIDGSLADYQWHYKTIRRLKEKGYAVHLIFVLASDKTILARVKKRGESNGRVIAADHVLKNIAQVKESFAFFQNKDDIDHFLVIDNEDIPQLIAYREKGKKLSVDDYSSVQDMNTCLRQ